MLIYIPTQVEINEKDLDRWPRRLLHVPSMTSHEWQPGNRYGSFTEPSYNVVSYTWGRYELERSSMPGVKAVPIHGLTWDVPRIDPAHFSHHDFERLIHRSATYRSNYIEGTKPDKLPPEHLWLDIACIDQEDEIMKRSEVGRQALIFKNAETALVWLSHHDTEQLDQYLGGLLGAIDQMECGSTIGWARTAAEAMALILQDPWFSSLWTLQEAFLRKDALLLSLQGDCASAEQYRKIDLRLLTLCCTDLSLGSIPDLKKMLHPSEWTDMIRLKHYIQESGLGLIYSDSPFILYTGARFRNPKSELDRIYGIMQIFDLRLGNTAKGVEEKTFALLELEDQLGTALLEKWPIRSQFHVHTKPVLFGRSWHISESSEFPELCLEFDHDFDKWFRPQCRLSTMKVDDVTWGYFKGKACRLEELAAAWKHWSNYHPQRAWPSPERRIPTDRPLQWIALDATDALREAPSSLQALNQLILPQDQTQHEVCSTLVQMFGDRVIVLLMSQNAGLILLRQQAKNLDYWHRLGICHWSAKETNDDLLLGRDTSRWWELEGLFG